MSKRAVFYARVSTADQVDGTSLQTQQEWCVKEIEKQGMTLADSYVDAGVSGADQSRPEWQRLLQGARSGNFDAVFVFDLDRFTRNMLHGLQATQDLRELGIALYDAKNPLVDVASVDANLLTAFRFLIAEEERNKIKERTVRGQRARLQEGSWPGGKPSYGWRLEGISTRHPRPVPDEGERENLNLIRHLIVEDGFSVLQVAERLNLRGIPSRTGGRWSNAVVQRIITNPALHRGWFYWGAPKGENNDGRSRKTKVDKNGRPVYGAPGKIELPEPVFTKRQFDETCSALTRRAKRRGNATSAVSRILTTQIFGRCGRHYTGTSIAGKDYDVYRCTGNRIRGNTSKAERCGCPQINAQKIEGRVWSEICNLLTSPERLKVLAENWIGIRQTETGKSSSEELEQAATREGQLRRALERAQDDYYLAESVEAESLRGRIDQYKEELKKMIALRDHLETAMDDEASVAARILTVSELAFHAQNRLPQMSDKDKREVCNLLDIRVFISDITDSEPQTISIHGQLDERLVDGGEQQSGFVRGLQLSFELAGPQVNDGRHE